MHHHETNYYMKTNNVAEEYTYVSKVKFCACFYLDISFFNILLTEEMEKDSIFKRDALDKMMINHGMEEYTDLLYHYFVVTDLKFLKVVIEETDANFENYLTSKKELNQLFQFLLKPARHAISSLNLFHARDKYTVKNNSNIEGMIECFKQYYIKKRDVRFEKVIEEEKDDVTLENVNSALSAIEDALTKYNKGSNNRGRKFENYIPTQIGLYLSFLKRIDSFVTNNNDIDDIKDIKLTNRDYRFVHDCLVYCKLIEDKSNNQNTTTTPEKYTRNLLTTLRLVGMERYRLRSGAYLFFGKSADEVIAWVNCLKNKIICLSKNH